MAKALDHAHECGILHRDIKPANILMSRDGIPLLADFNLAENATSGDSQRADGTLAYMPLEQIAIWLCETKTINARRADIYSLVLVLWELANGERPFADQEKQLATSGRQKLLDLMNVRRNAVSRKDTGAKLGLEMILQRAMAVDPTSRFPSARAMATALHGLEELQRDRRDPPAKKLCSCS